MSKDGILQVVEGGYCIGCGACAVAQSESIQMEMDSRIGLYQAWLKDGADLGQASKACPFATECPDENELSRNLFPDAISSDIIGSYLGLFAGYAVETQSYGSSGGMLTWLLKKLLDENKVDAVICVEPTDNPDERFRYTVVSSSSGVLRCAKSAYYPVAMAHVLEYVRKNEGRYAITGIPCFHKALRALRRIDPVLDDRICFQIGLVCGQMKSSFYADYLVRLTGMEPAQTGKVCFREKNLEGKANHYYFTAQSLENEKDIRRVSNRFIGNNWAMGYFKPLACDFCDDVFAETADFVAMDAWLPKYLDDSQGYSLVINRHPELQVLLDNGSRNGELVLEQTTETDLIASQKGGLNHRRIGLRYRLFLKLKRKEWVPTKRVSPSDDHSFLFKGIQHTRQWMRKKTFDAYLSQRGHPGLGIFNRKLKVPLLVFRVLNRISASSRLGKQPSLEELVKKYHLDGRNR